MRIKLISALTALALSAAPAAEALAAAPDQGGERKHDRGGSALAHFLAAPLAPLSGPLAERRCAATSSSSR